MMNIWRGVMIACCLLAGRMLAAQEPIMPRWVGWGPIGGMILSNAGDELRTKNILTALQAESSNVPMFLLSAYLKTDARYATHARDAASGRNAAEMIYHSDRQVSAIWIHTARLDFLCGEKKWHLQVSADFTSDSILRSAAVIFGDLRTSPFYAVAGLDYVWFSPFNTDVLYSCTLNKILFRPGNVPLVAGGYWSDTWQGELTIFQALDGTKNGVTRLHQPHNINDFAFQGSYSFHAFKAACQASGAYVYNLKAVGGSSYRGSLNYAITSGDNHDPISALDACFKMAWRKVAFSAEYNVALRECLQQNSTYSHPQALSLEGQYSFCWEKPMEVVLNYGITRGANLVMDTTLDDSLADFLSQKQQVMLCWLCFFNERITGGIEGTWEKNYAGNSILAATVEFVFAF